MIRPNSDKDCLSYNIKLLTNSQMKKELDRCCNYAKYIWNLLLELELKYQSEHNGKRSPAGYLLKKCRELRKKNIWELKLPEYIMCQTERKFRTSLSEIIEYNIDVKNSNDYTKEYKNLKFKTKKYDKMSFDIPNTKYGEGSFEKQGKNFKFSIYLSAKSEVKRKYRMMKITELPKGYSDGTSRILRSSIFKEDDEYYVSFCMEKLQQPKLDKGIYSKVGIDPGIKSVMTLSNGKKYKYLSKLKKLEKLKRFYQSRVAKRYVNGAKHQSKNFYRARTKLIKIRKKIRNLKRDWLHKITTSIAKKYREIHWEDIQPSKLMKNHKLANAISNSNWYNIKTLLDYKVTSRGGLLVSVKISKAATQTCCKCGYVKKRGEKLTLNDRMFNCPICGNSLDRDVNAAKNIKKFY